MLPRDREERRSPKSPERRGASFSTQRHHQNRKKAAMSEQSQPTRSIRNDAADVAKVAGCVVGTMVITAIIAMTVMAVTFMITMSNLRSDHSPPTTYSATNR
jgi:hypothetical protein